MFPLAQQIEAQRTIFGPTVRVHRLPHELGFTVEWGDIILTFISARQVMVKTLTLKPDLP